MPRYIRTWLESLNKAPNTAILASGMAVQAPPPLRSSDTDAIWNAHRGSNSVGMSSKRHVRSVYRREPNGLRELSVKLHIIPQRRDKHHNVRTRLLFTGVPRKS